MTEHRAHLELNEDVQKIKSAFLHFDRDNDATISTVELSAMLEYLGLPAADQDVGKLCEEVDKDCNGQISCDELEIWAIKQGGMKSIFKRLRQKMESSSGSDPDETQRLSLMETGITPESLSFWSPTFAESERLAIVELKSEQRHAVAHTRTISQYYHRQAWTRLLAKAKALGFKDKDVFATLDYIREQAPLIIHLQLDKQIGDEQLIDKLHKDTHYRNQFETGVSGGYLGTHVRAIWEHDLFGDAYDKAQGGDRPKYGVLNNTNDPLGCATCRQYGDSYLLLKDVRLRTTFSAEDSANLKAEELACCDYYAHVLNEYSDKELGITLLVGSGKVESAPSHDIRAYKEAQFHGMVLLKKHILKLVAHERLKKDDAFKAKVEACCKEHNFQLCWMDELQDELKRKNYKRARILAVGDLVVAKFPKYRGKKDDPWFAGTVTAIDTEAMRCSIQYEDGDKSADVQETEVLFAPSRDPQWGKGCMRANDLAPRETSPVVFKAHVLAVGDLVVAKFVRRRYDKTWYAGTVTKIDMDKMRCSIKYSDLPDTADPLDDVKEDEVLYAPSRDPQWGKDKLRGVELVPHGAAPVVYQVSGGESKTTEAPITPTPMGGGKCERGLHDMVRWSDTVPSAYRSYICNGCRELKSGNRWFCPDCKCDYCFTCRPVTRAPTGKRAAEPQTEPPQKQAKTGLSKDEAAADDSDSDNLYQ